MAALRVTAIRMLQPSRGYFFANFAERWSSTAAGPVPATLFTLWGFAIGSVPSEFSAGIPEHAAQRLRPGYAELIVIHATTGG